MTVRKCKFCAKVRDIAYTDRCKDFYLHLCKSCAIELGWEEYIQEFLEKAGRCKCGNEYIKEKSYQFTCFQCYERYKKRKKMQVYLMER